MWIYGQQKELIALLLLMETILIPMIDIHQSVLFDTTGKEKKKVYSANSEPKNRQSRPVPSAQHIVQKEFIQQREETYSLK